MIDNLPSDEVVAKLLNGIGVVSTPMKDPFGTLTGVRYTFGDVGCLEIAIAIAPKYHELIPPDTIVELARGFEKRFAEKGVTIKLGDGW